MKSVAVLLCLAFAASAFAQGSPESSGATTGMKFLHTNDKGFGEYLWLKDSSVMVKIPAGKFAMGSVPSEAGDTPSDQQPQHVVSISDFYMDKFEMTNKQYKRFCDATGRDYPPAPEWLLDYFTTRPDYPVMNVSWDDAQAYAAWVGKRLPTEAEWEKAARGTDGRKYPWGDSDPQPIAVKTGWAEWANYDDWPPEEGKASDGRPVRVGSYPSGASFYGCMDMAGNVFEWCNDWYDASYYGRSAIENPKGPTSGSARVGRGGCCTNSAKYIGCARRDKLDPSKRTWVIGFRCASSQ